MTAQGKPDRCPSCGSDERSKCNLLPTPAGYEDLCCDDWHSSPVPAARKQFTTDGRLGCDYCTMTFDDETGKLSHTEDCSSKSSAPQAESVPSGKWPYKRYAMNAQSPSLMDEHDNGAYVLYGAALAFAASQTAALASERDKVQAELNETIEDAVCGTKRILELERSNSLLRERLTAAEGVLKKCDDIAMDERVPNHKALEEIVRQIDAYFEKENQ